MFSHQGYINSFPHFLIKLEQGTEVPDYLSIDIGGILCSERLMKILEIGKGQEDEIQWIKVDIIDLQGKIINYYFLHFPQKYEVLDKQLTMYSPSKNPIVPTFSSLLLKGHRVFSYHGSGCLTLIIHENVKKEIQKAGCTGITFSRQKIV